MKHAKPANFATFLDDLQAACMHVLRALGRAARTIAALPWPALLVAALLFALVLTVVPLALFIFVVFMAIKFAVAAIVVERRRNRRD